jgi:hypothetical protein
MTQSSFRALYCSSGHPQQGEDIQEKNMPMTDGEREAAGNVLNDNFRAARWLTKADLESEIDLDQRKWFDYRFMTPLRATEQFVAEYVKVFQRKYDQNFDSSQAANKSGTRSRNWKSCSQEFTAFWRARQVADYVGVPYAHYLEPAVEHLLRRGYENIPRPNQLYSKKTFGAIEGCVTDHWSECCDVEFKFSQLPQYHIAAFRGLPAQSAHQDWIVRQIQARHSRIEDISRFCFVEAVLLEDRARREFGDEKVGLAIEHFRQSKDVIRPFATLTGDQHWPSCFGISQVSMATSTTCQGCEVLRSCHIISTGIDKTLIKLCGSNDPVTEKRKHQQRERTRKFRAKAAAAAPSAGI